jgi:hypothetical protein
VNPVSSITSSKGRAIAPVTIHPFGDMIKINYQDSNKYAGIANVPALCEILNAYNVKFTATLVTQSKSQTGGREKIQRLTPHKEALIRIVIYGLKSERLVVGTVLSDAGLYLQHPLTSEYGGGIEYLNPHYLIRPGSSMPNLDQSSLYSKLGRVATSEKLEEMDKNRLAQLFDFAYDSSIRPQIVSSARLRSTLKP